MNERFLNKVDLVELLRSPSLVGQYRGRDAYLALKEKIEAAHDKSLTVVDLSAANPLQYIFCEHAFGFLFEELGLPEWRNKYILFKMKPFHEASFFYGLLRHFNQAPFRKQSKDVFCDCGHHIKTIVSDAEVIEFVGNLSDIERNILKKVNEALETTLRQLSDSVGAPDEEVLNSLVALKDHKFIIDREDQESRSHRYVSFYSFFAGSGNE